MTRGGKVSATMPEEAAVAAGRAEDEQGDEESHGDGATLPSCGESWCRVESLSLTGRIMYWVAHRFVVHWPELARRYPRAEYLGRIC